MTFKNALLAGTAALAITVASNTATFAQQQRRPATPAQNIALKWDGFYAGAHIGYGRQKTGGCFDCTDGSVPLSQNDLKLRGFLGGVQIGRNWQSGNMVFGLEGDLSFMRWKDKKWDTPSTGTSNAAAKVDMLSSVRARLGVAVDRGLWYGTAGIAMAKARTSVLNSGDARTFKFNTTGAVVGAGYEWAATNNLRYRLEGLYYIFDKTKTDPTFHSFAAGHDNRLKNAFTIKLGASYYFGN